MPPFFSEAVGSHLPSASPPRPPVLAYPQFPAPAGFCQAFPGYSWLTSVIQEQDLKLGLNKETFGFFMKVSNVCTACRRSNLESIKWFMLALVGDVDSPETYFQILNGVSRKSNVSGSESLFPRPNPGLFPFYQPH